MRAVDRFRVKATLGIAMEACVELYTINESSKSSSPQSHKIMRHNDKEVPLQHTTAVVFFVDEKVITWVC